MLKHSALGLVLSFALFACSQEPRSASSSAQDNVAHSNQKIELLNVSYDVIRDFYKAFNPLFIQHFQAAHPETQITIQQSHGGSSKQALSVVNGLQADVVSMNQVSDIELLQKKNLVDSNWANALPNQAIPFTSTTVFLVRKGNPKAVHDWTDLTRNDIKIVLSNPKTSGNGRYTFLAAFGFALKHHNNNHAAAQDFTKKLFANVAVLEAGGRSATTTFLQRNIGDVLITFENEAQLAIKQFDSGAFEIVYPSYSIAAENPVALVKSVTEKKGSTKIAEEYLNYLWSEPAQELAASLYLRPSDERVLAKHQAQFPAIETFRATDVFGSWQEITQTYFVDGGVFDQINQH
jgi:sulfate transport system substrate-binding protein